MCGDRFERRRVLLPVHPVDGRHAFDSLDLLAVDPDRGDEHEAVGVTIRRRREEDALDQAEDGGRRTNADSKRKRGEGREARPLEQHANGEPKVVQHSASLLGKRTVGLAIRD
jgi:hypothetical protein